MATETKQVYLWGGANLGSLAPSVGGFIWHFVQMVVAMEVGMMVYHKLVWPVLAQTAYASLTDAYPLIGYWMMVVSMVLGMLAVMIYHRSTWRYSLEMTIAMVAPLAALTVLAVCSLIPNHILYGVGDPVMFVAMAAFMLYRPHEHEHAHGGHQHSGHQEAGSPQVDSTQRDRDEVHEENQEEHACHTA